MPELKLSIKSYLPDDQQPIDSEPLEQEIEYVLSTNHAASSYGVPVLIAADGTAYGAADHLPLACAQPAWLAVRFAFDSLDNAISDGVFERPDWFDAADKLVAKFESSRPVEQEKTGAEITDEDWHNFGLNQIFISRTEN